MGQLCNIFRLSPLPASVSGVVVEGANKLLLRTGASRCSPPNGRATPPRSDAGSYGALIELPPSTEPPATTSTAAAAAAAAVAAAAAAAQGCPPERSTPGIH